MTTENGEMCDMNRRFTTPEVSHFRESIAYTEDDIPVQRLHFFGVPPEETEDTLKEYFQRFGIILEWRLDRNSKSECLSGDVLFAKAEDAARVLLCYPHHLYGTVNPSYSWQQPKACGSPQESGFFWTLNDDCWAHIMQFLKLSDKIRFARTHPCFKTAYQMTTAGQYKSVDMLEFDQYTLWDIWDFFQMSGYQVQDIKYLDIGIDNHDNMIDMITIYCPNLISISLVDVSKDDMLEMPTSIEKLDLRYCEEIENLPIVCKHFSKLRELYIREAQVSDDILREFADLKNLEELWCNGYSLSYSAILDLFIACPKLSHLGIYYLSKPPYELLLSIVDRVRQEMAREEMHRKLPIKLGTDKKHSEKLVRQNHIAVPKDIIHIESDNPDYSSEKEDDTDGPYDGYYGNYCFY